MKLKKGLGKEFILEATDDITFDNYVALLGAILLDPTDKNYRKIIHNKSLFDKSEEIKRIKKIDEIREKGGQTELQIWYANVNPISHNNNKSKSCREMAKQRQIEYMKKKQSILEKYKKDIIDVSNMSVEDIRKYKVKVINIVNDDITIYEYRKEITQALGISTRTITTYIKTGRIYRNKFIFTIAHDMIDEVALAQMQPNKRIKATNFVTGEEKIFNKIKEASDFFNLKYITFHHRYKYRSIKQYGDWLLEDI